MNVVVYSVHPEHPSITEVREIKAPLELVVTSTTPVKSARPLLGSVDENVVVYLVHPTHAVAADRGITDVLVIKTPFEFVVTSTTPVKVAIPPEESAEVKVVVYLVHPTHSVVADLGITDVLVVKAPIEFVVTSTTPVKVARELSESSEVNVVVYLVQTEHSEAPIREVSVVNAPFEFVVTSTTPVNVARPPLGPADVNVVVYSEHSAHPVVEAARTEVRVIKTPMALVVTSTTPVKVLIPPVESPDVNVVVYSVHPEH